MINSMITWWVRNHVAANLLMIGIFIAGLLGFSNVEREVFPTFNVSMVEVLVPWPGAAAREVEEQIVIRVEEAIVDLDNIEHILGTASEGMARIVIQANNKVDPSTFVSEIKRRVDGISSFPRNIERPLVRTMTARNEIIRLALHGDLSERRLKRLAEKLRDQVAALPGISIVEVFGVRNEEVSIEISEQTMRRYGISFDELSAAIRGSSLNISSGRIETETGDIALRTRNLADTDEDFSRIIVRQDDAGGTLYLGDLANIHDDLEDIELLTTFNGQPAVLIQAMSTERMDIVKASESMNNWLSTARANLPQGISLSLLWDQADAYHNRMATIGNSAISGLCLVFIVLLFSLRARVAIWVTVGIFIAFVGSFALLPAADVSLNIFSTFAFLLVLGIIVDDAIVIGDSIHYVSEQQGGGINTAVTGTTNVAKPVLFSVITTMIAFIPWFFLSGDKVQLTRQISAVIVLALTISLIEALLILPAHLRNLPPEKNIGRFTHWRQKISGGIVTFANTRYRKWVSAAIANRYLTASAFFTMLIISIGVYTSGWVAFAFMPEMESDQIVISVEMPAGSPYKRSLEIFDRLQLAEQQLQREVKTAAMSEGGSGQLIENWYTLSRRGNVYAIVKLVAPDDRQMPARTAALRLQELIGDIPDAREIRVDFTMNDSTPTLAYAVSHPDLDTLRQAISELQAQLTSYDKVFIAHHNLENTEDELRLSLLPGAEMLGLNLQEVSRQVRQAYYGEEVQRLPRLNGDVRVMLRYPLVDRRNLESLDNFRVRTPDGRAIPLFAVASVEYHKSTRQIKRRDRQRYVLITARLNDDSRQRIMKDLEASFFPDWKKRYPDIKVNLAGQAEGENQFVTEMLSLYAVAFFLMYALLAVAFSSYWHPIIIMTAIPFGFMGAVYGHLFFGISMALFSYFGIAAVAGVVVNNNLVLMDYAHRLRAQGLDPLTAMIESGVQRFRPILLTSLTTFIGLVPMMMERSTQTQFLHPAVVSLAFGVLFAQFVTLLLVPALYAIGEDCRALLERTKNGMGLGIAESTETDEVKA